MSREALVLLVCCCDFRDGAEWLIPSKSLRNAVIWAFPGLLCILRMCAPRRAAAVVRPRGREKSADRRRRILISRLLIIRASVPRWKSPFPAYFKGFPAVSPLIPPYPAFLKYPVSPQKDDKTCKDLGPALKHKLQAQNKKVVEEFDRAKQRMYKRYERALDPNKKASKRDLSYAEYYEWLENATEARDAYLAGTLSEKDALKVIREDFVNRDKM